MMDQYKKPLFIVGVPRSGTKLLRDILNGHSLINIPIVETHFIPKWIQRYGTDRNLSVGECNHLWNDFLDTNFVKLHKEKYNILPPKKEDFFSLSGKSLPEMICFLLTYYGPKKHDHTDQIIWGDKTPSYINHIQLLKASFPQAKFIQIIRDPRDVALSTLKTWGTGIRFTAYRYRASMLYAHDIFAQMDPNDFIQIYYEELLQSPEVVLRSVCSFLKIPFEQEMMTLQFFTEHYGDARGMTQLLTTNIRKYKKELSKGAIYQIEALTYDIMKQHQQRYSFESSVKEHIILSPMFVKFLWKINGLRRLWFDIKDKGLRKGIRYFFQQKAHSAWNVLK